MARLMVGGPMTVLALALAFHARAADEPAWQVSETSGLVRYAMHGTVVHGNWFGFIKKRGRCDDDMLWLLWSSSDARVHRLKGAEFELAMAVDGTSFKLKAKLIAARDPIPHITVVTFANFVSGKALIALLGGGEKIAINITGPAAKLFNVRKDEFPLAGFAAARRRAKATCERRPA